MLMRTFLILLFCCLILLPQPGYSNAAQPGIFDAGGTGNFVLLFPGDSVYFRKIQMIDEHIAIQLYRGFAVVRGEYKMLNATDSPVSIKVGYPVNASIHSGDDNYGTFQVFFDQLFALKSYTNGKENSLIIQPAAERLAIGENNWYVWESTFKPKDTTTLTVYFVVNTNNTIVREGYTIDKNNGFIYLLETGATWKQPIANGEVKIALMDDIHVKDIRGISPSSVFRVNEADGILYYHFNDLYPTGEDNIVLVYTDAIEKFDFSYVSQKRQLLFGSIDSFAKQNVDQSRLMTMSFKNPFKVQSTSFGAIISLFAILGFSVIALIVLVWLLRVFFRYLRSRRPTRGTEI